MTAQEIISITAICFGPVAAISISLFFQNRKEKRQKKFETFFGLAANRDPSGTHPTFVYHLNTIDIVFHDCPKILKAWKEYFDYLNSSTPPVNAVARQKRLDLLHAIAQELGYKGWKQTDMEKYYLPIAHLNQTLVSQDTQTQLLSFLQNWNVVLEAQKKSQEE